MTHKNTDLRELSCEEKHQNTRTALIKLYADYAKLYPALFEKLTEYRLNTEEYWYIAEYQGLELACELSGKTHEIINDINSLQEKAKTDLERDVLSKVSIWVSRFTKDARVYLIPIAEEFVHGDPKNGGRFIIVYNERANLIFKGLPDYYYTDTPRPFIYKGENGETAAMGIDIAGKMLKAGKEAILAKSERVLLLGTLQIAAKDERLSKIDRHLNLSKIKDLFYTIHGCYDYTGQYLTGVYGSAITEILYGDLYGLLKDRGGDVSARHGYIVRKHEIADDEGDSYTVLKININNPFTDYEKRGYTVTINPLFDYKEAFTLAL